MQRSSLWKDKQDKGNSVRAAIEEYLNYVRYYESGISQKKLDNMKTYFVFFAKKLEEMGIKDLTKKREYYYISEFAKKCVTMSKSECAELKDITMSDRANFYNAFVDFVSDGKVYSKKAIKLEKIPPVLSDLERRLDIVKNFRNHMTEDKQKLCERYYVKERTLRTDFAEIKNGCLNAFEQVVDIDYDMENKSLFSTPVPLFLVQNITQIVAVLNGLAIQAEDPRYNAYAKTTAMLIWKQLTPDVKKRIKNDLVELLHLDAEWYECLENESEDFKLKYYTERMIDCQRGNVLMLFKNGMPCDVSYFKDNEIVRLKGVRLIDTRSDYFITSNSEEKIEYCNIIAIEETGN